MESSKKKRLNFRTKQKEIKKEKENVECHVVTMEYASHVTFISQAIRLKYTCVYINIYTFITVRCFTKKSCKDFEGNKCLISYGKTTQNKRKGMKTKER